MSPVAMVIIIFAALIPNKPRRTFAVSVASAAMDTVALIDAVMHGNPVPAPWQLVLLLGGRFVAVPVATLISGVVHGLAKVADEAHTMGSYELTEKLGGGGMGEVWRARHRFLARPAAIKLIRSEASADAGAVRRFEREAQATAALRDPHTIQLYDFGVTDDGIDGKLAGTPAYLAPELALDEKNVDGRADIYALGCVGYWLLTGKLVFDGDTAMKLILAHAHARPVAPSLRTENPIPEALDVLIMDCLEKDRERRPRSATDFAERLAKVPLQSPWTRDKREAFWSEAAADAPKQLENTQSDTAIALLETQAAP